MSNDRDLAPVPELLFSVMEDDHGNWTVGGKRQASVEEVELWQRNCALEVHILAIKRKLAEAHTHLNAKDVYIRQLEGKLGYYDSLQ